MYIVLRPSTSLTKGAKPPAPWRLAWRIVQVQAKQIIATWRGLRSIDPCANSVHVAHDIRPKLLQTFADIVEFDAVFHCVARCCCGPLSAWASAVADRPGGGQAGWAEIHVRVRC